jgi:hypothetical protein
MHFGQAQVQNQQIEFTVGHHGCIGFAATGYVVHCSACAAQSAQQTVSKHLIVFGYQNAHGCLLLLWLPVRHRLSQLPVPTASF